jgi:hypothetical protein
MAWTLKNGTRTLVVDGTVAVGRSDFPEVGKLSRKHFEFSVRMGKVFVRDLASRNGTILNGNRLEPGIAVEMRSDDVLTVGGAVFRLYDGVVPADNPPAVAAAASSAAGRILGHLHATAKIDAAIFGALCLIPLCDRSIAFGFAIGFVNACVLFGTILIAVLACAAGANFIFREAATDRRQMVKYVITVGLASLVVGQVLIQYADYLTGLGDDFVEAKIEYFCMDHFKQPECVRQVNLCPKCAIHIDKWKRDKMLHNLKTFRDRYPAAAQGATKEPKNGPALNGN